MQLKIVRLVLVYVVTTLIAGEVSAQTKQSKRAWYVYDAVATYYFKGSPSSILVGDSTLNKFIVVTNFLDKAFPKTIQGGYVVKYLTLDSSWVKTLMKADIIKSQLKKKRITNRIRSDNSFSIINKKTFTSTKDSAYLIKHVYEYSAEAFIEFSDVLFVGNRAIVEASILKDINRGETLLLFLEKKDKKYSVIGTYRTEIL